MSGGRSFQDGPVGGTLAVALGGDWLLVFRESAGLLGPGTRVASKLVIFHAPFGNR
jgi:hypothetical protein